MSLLCQGRENGGEIGLLQNSSRFQFLVNPSEGFNIFDKFQLVIEFIKVCDDLFYPLLGIF